PALCAEHIAALSGPGLERAVAAHAHSGGGARQSRMAYPLPGESGDQRKGHESQRRTQISEGANADLQLLAERDSGAREVLRSPGLTAFSVRGRAARTPHRAGARAGAGPVLFEGSTVLEVPPGRRRASRSLRHRSEFPDCERTAQAWLDIALDVGSTGNQ